MSNTNCLEGIRCPECGHEDMFRMEVTTMATVTDDGTDFDRHDGVDWDENSYCECANCFAHGKLSRFKALSDAASEPSEPTPGPWTCNESGMVRGAGPGDADGPPFVCDVTIDCSMGLSTRERANGRLITAAPEMLEAIDMAESELERMEAITGHACDIQVMTLLRAARAKAKGGAQ